MVHTMAGDGTIADDVIDNNVRRSTANPPAAATTATSRRHHHRSCSGDNVEVGRGTELKTYRNNSSLRFVLYCAIGLCVTVSVLNYPSRFMTSYYSEDVPNHNVLTVPSFPTSRQRHSNNNSNDNDNSNSNNNNTNNNRGTSDSVGIDHRHHNNTTTRTKTKTSNTAAPTIPTIPGTGTTTGTTTTIDRIRDNDPVDTKTKKEKKNILYVHFHKAGGTSIINYFHKKSKKKYNIQQNQHYLWEPNANGNPRRVTGWKMIGKPNARKNQTIYAMIQFWKYNTTTTTTMATDGGNGTGTGNGTLHMTTTGGSSRSSSSRTQTVFQDFMEEGYQQQQQHLRSNADNGNMLPLFFAMEWNYFEPEYFSRSSTQTHPKTHPKTTDDTTTATTTLLQTLLKQYNIALLTCLRDPYARFKSSFFYRGDNPGGNTNPKFLRDPLGTYGHEDLRFKAMRWGANDTYRVNVNKPNYYTAFLNGYGQNDQEDEDEDDTTTSNIGNYSRHTRRNNYDYNYFACCGGSDSNTTNSTYGLNRTHLEIAKQRLDMFDTILILEDPATHHQLLPYKPTTTKQSTTDTERTILSSKNTLAGKRGRGNPNYLKKLQAAKEQFQLSRAEFFHDNQLDYELYQYAITLASAAKQTTHTLAPPPPQQP